jgi:hypothetical protein
MMAASPTDLSPAKKFAIVVSGQQPPGPHTAMLNHPIRFFWPAFISGRAFCVILVATLSADFFVMVLIMALIF